MKSEPEERLNAFYGMLEARRFALTIRDPAPPCVNHLNSLLADKERSWNKAYQAEEMLNLLIPEGSLVAAFKAIAVEARQNLDKDQVDRREADFNGHNDAPSRRLTLQALAEDLHEHWATEDERGTYYERITRSTAKFLIWFIASLVVLLLLHAFVGVFVLQPLLTRSYLLAALVVFIVLAAGLFGAGLSMLTGLQSRLEAASMSALERMDSAINRWARSAIGAGAALALLGLSVAGLLEGKLVPTLDGSVLRLDAISPQTLANLVIASIAAGFSEKLVPSKLGGVESTL